MKRFLLIAFLFLFSVSCQAAFPHFPFASCRLELPLLVIFYSCFTFPLLQGGIFILASGLLLEAWSIPLAGIITVSYLIVLFTAKVLENHLFLEGIRMRGLWTAIFFLLQKGLMLIFFHKETLFPSGFFLILQSLVHGLGSLVLFSLVFKAEGWLKRRS